MEIGKCDAPLSCGKGGMVSQSDERSGFRLGFLSMPASHGASSSYAMIFHFSFSLAQSKVRAAECSPGVRKVKSVA